MGTVPVCPQRIAPSLLSAWHDQALGNAESERLREHIEQCAACQATLDGFTTVDTRLRQFGRQPVPAMLRNQGSMWRMMRMTIVQRQGVASMPRSRGILWGLGVALTAALVVVIVVVQSSQAHKSANSSAAGTLTAAQQAWGSHYKTTIPLGKVDPSTLSIASNWSAVDRCIHPHRCRARWQHRRRVHHTENRRSTRLERRGGHGRHRYHQYSLRKNAANRADFHHEYRIVRIPLVVTDGRYIVWYESDNNSCIYDRQTQKVAASIPAFNYSFAIKMNIHRRIFHPSGYCLLS